MLCADGRLREGRAVCADAFRQRGSGAGSGRHEPLPLEQGVSQVVFRDAGRAGEGRAVSEKQPRGDDSAADQRHCARHRFYHRALCRAVQPHQPGLCAPDGVFHLCGREKDGRSLGRGGRPYIQGDVGAQAVHHGLRSTEHIGRRIVPGRFRRRKRRLGRRRRRHVRGAGDRSGAGELCGQPEGGLPERRLADPGHADRREGERTGGRHRLGRRRFQGGLLCQCPVFHGLLDP